MPRAIPMALRKSVIDQCKKGISKTQIALNLGIGRTSVHKMLQMYEEQGDAGLLPNYGNCGRNRPGPDDLIYRSVRCFRTWHPKWGADKIKAELHRLRPTLNLPSTKTLYRWFHWNQQITSRSRLPAAPRQWAKSLHEGWQIDAKEQMQTQDGKKSCWLNIVDEHSGTVIDPPVFPLQKHL